MERFEKDVKPAFEDSSHRSYLKFGLRRDNDSAVGIKNGQMALDGYTSCRYCCAITRR